MDSIRKAIAALKVAIQTERDGYQFYQEAASRTRDPGGKELFTTLANDEIVHERILKERLETLESEGGWEAVAEQQLPPSSLPAEGIPIFSRERVQQNVGEYTYELSALRMAYLIEKDAVAFYTRAAEETDDPAGKAMFEQLVGMERTHQRVLEEEYRFLAGQFKTEMGFAPF